VSVSPRKMLYSRLSMCKQIGNDLAAHKHRELLANPVASELGLEEPNGPPAVLYQMMRDQGARDDRNVIYPYLLEAIEKVFDHDLDQGTFEEHMRWFFGGKVRAYQALRWRGTWPHTA
jgi:paired amphipathic helix protein Sin3a